MPEETQEDYETHSLADAMGQVSERISEAQTDSVVSQSSRYQCSQCDKGFKTSKLLREHFSSSHTNDGFPHKCYVCGEGFVDLPSKTEHAEQHKAEQKFKC